MWESLPYFAWNSKSQFCTVLLVGGTVEYNLMVRKKIFGAVVFVLAVVGMYCVFQYIGNPITASAHAGGTYLKAQSGSSTIVVEYEGEKVVQYGFTRFNLNLIVPTTTDVEIEVPHDAVWARIEHDNEILYAGWLYKPDGLQAGFSYMFQNAGDYVLSTRFHYASGTIAEGAVKFSVIGSGVSESHLIIFIIGLLVGGVLILSLGRKHMFGH